MNLTDQLLKITLLGAEWVLWLLLILSVASIAVIVERALFFRRRRVDLSELGRDLRAALRGDEVAAVERKYGGSPALAARVAVAGLRAQGDGIDAVTEAMNAAKSRERDEHERNLVLLGTLGNNAPFIGLFGTVLGIIQAFFKLRQNPTGGFELVMGSVSEALVATAVGLFVAIPAVIAFNFYNRMVRTAVNAADTTAHELLAALRGREAEAAGGARAGQDQQESD